MFPVSLLHRYAKDRPPVRAGLIGAGHFGTAVLAQARVSPLAEMRVVADSRIEAAIDACRQAADSPLRQLRRRQDERFLT